MRLGLHVPVGGGYAAALERIKSLGLSVAQMLPYPRHHEPSDAELAEFKAGFAAVGGETLLVHSRFVPSLASSDGARRARSAEHLRKELSYAERLGSEFYVLHAGAYSPGASSGDGEKLFAESVGKALSESRFSGTLLLENVPGGGRRMGGSLEELARLADSVGRRAPRLGVCLDTAHAHAAGYDLSCAEGALKLLSRAHRLLGERVRAFHLNDTRALLGSRREDHRHWGEGRLGTEGLAALLAREEFAGAPAVIEPPRGSPEKDADSLALARALARA